MEKIFFTCILFRLVVFTPDLVEIVGCFEVKLSQLPHTFTEFYQLRLCRCGWSYELFQLCLVSHGLQEELNVTITFSYTSDLLMNGDFCLIGRKMFDILQKQDLVKLRNAIFSPRVNESRLQVQWNGRAELTALFTLL